MRRLLPIAALLTAGVSLAAVPACGTGSTAGCTDGGHVITADQLEELENAHETIHQGTAADSSDGRYKLSFTTEPSPPVKGDATFTVTVKTPAGAPYDGADVLLQVFGVDGQDADQTPTTTDKGAGVYEVKPVTFDVAGAWVVKIHVSKGGDEATHDHAKFSVIIPEAP